MNIDLSVVIPIYNEAESLLALQARLIPVLDKLECSCEVLIVDDGSSDSTWELILRATVEGQARDPGSRDPGRQVAVRGLRLRRNFGKEAAIRAGLSASQGSAVIVMDGDLQHPPEVITELYATWKSGNVLVVEGVKRKASQHRTFVQKIGAWFLYTLLQRATGVGFESGTDFRLLDRSVVVFMLALPERISFFRGLLSYYKFPSTTVEFDAEVRSKGISRWSLIALIHFGLDALTGFTSTPLRVVTFCSIGFLLFFMLLLLQTLYRYFVIGSVEGFTTVILVILIVGAVVTAALGIIGEYVARIYEEVKRRPRYVIGDTANLILDQAMRDERVRGTL